MYLFSDVNPGLCTLVLWWIEGFIPLFWCGSRAVYPCSGVDSCYIYVLVWIQGYIPLFWYKSRAMYSCFGVDPGLFTLVLV